MRCTAALADSLFGDLAMCSSPHAVSGCMMAEHAEER
jgi:hypothetical protein